MNLRRRIGMWATALACALTALASSPASADRPLSEQGYIGLALRDIASDDTVVSWIFPGPLDGAGLTSATFDLGRPDLVVAVDDQPMNAEAFRAYVRGRAPGTPVTITYRRARERGGRIPEQPNHHDELSTITVTLASRDMWTGTMHRARGHDTTITLEEPGLLDPHDASNVLGRAVASHGLVEPLDVLLGVFRTWLERDTDFHMLSRVRAGFTDPFCLPELERMLTDPTHDIIDEPVRAAMRLMRANLDLPPVEFEQRVATGPIGALEASVLPAVDELAQRLDAALGDLAHDRAFAERCLALARVPRETFYIAGERTAAHLEVIRRSMDVDFAALISALEAVTVLNPPADALDGLDPIDPPAELAPAVDGPILYAFDDDEIGWIVFGSRAANRYDLARIAVIVDPGGDDAYTSSDLCLGPRVVIDFTGNDAYSGTIEQGAGAALLGVSFIDDRGGDDRYEGELVACGAAMFGVSLILDRAGNDVYRGREWSIGAAMYGAGMIVDLGRGGDQYLGDFLCQGVGGPRGFGCIIDDGGRDLYRANGPTPSAYGTPAIYQSFSQGIGFGFRHYAAGGIGMISDLGGDDRYEAGEFAQGGAYYYGLGILHDAAGRDLYYGNRYGQGFGVHQALGILADDGGDDTYWSMTAASQGAAWDIGAGLLIDRTGDDSYQCDGLGQGAASMQGIGMLVDLAGDDRYAARGGAIQGRSGGNRYHFHRTGAMSFSLLLDRSGRDHYSSGRPNEAITVTGEQGDRDPADAPMHGLLIDE